MGFVYAYMLEGANILTWLSGLSLMGVLGNER